MHFVLSFVFETFLLCVNMLPCKAVKPFLVRFLYKALPEFTRGVAPRENAGTLAQSAT